MEIVKFFFTPRGFVSLFIVGNVLAAIDQTMFQALAASTMIWGRNVGWQTEIAFWNIGMALVLSGVLISNKGVERNVIIGLTVLLILFGINHLTAAIKSPVSWGNWIGFLLNFVGCAIGCTILYKQFKRSKNGVEP